MYRISKKNSKQNPFITFAAEKKAEWEKEGRTFPGGIKEVVPLAGEIWKTMTEEEREPYKWKAKDWGGNQLEKKRHQIQTAKVADLLPLELVRAPTARNGDHHTLSRYNGYEERRDRAISGAIRQLLGVNNENHTTRAFVVISFSCVNTINKKAQLNTIERNYLPAEIGLVAFSLKDGVLNKYGTLIDPGDIALRNNVIKFNDHHGIPELSKWSEEASGIDKVMRDVKSFLRQYEALDDDGRCFLFCMKREIETTEECLDWLQNIEGSTSSKLKLNYELLSLDELFFQMVKLGNTNRCRLDRQEGGDQAREDECSNVVEKSGYATPHCALQFDNIFVQDEKNAEDETDGNSTAFAKAEEAGSYLQSQDYVHTSKLSCSYHEKNEVGARLCPLNKVHRYVFILLGFMIKCGYWEIVPKKGQHYV